MKKRGLFLLAVLAILLAAGCAAAEGDIAIDENNFPDSVFRAYVEGVIDTDHDGMLSPEEIGSVSVVLVPDRSVSDLTGLAYFTALEKLDCNFNSLTELDLSRNTALKELKCMENRLSTLDLSHNVLLENVNCSGNTLTGLDLSGNAALRVLNCNDNKLKKLELSGNSALEDLNCYMNRLTDLDVSGNLNLTRLVCGDNRIRMIDVSRNTALDTLSCNSNPLEKVDVSHNPELTRLDCNDTGLTSLDLSGNPKLEYLDIMNNSLTALDLSSNTSLQTFYSDNNQYDITTENGKISYKDLAGFDITRVLSVGGAEQGKTAFIVTDSVPIQYRYDCGNGFTMVFTVNVTYHKKAVTSISIPKAKYACTGKPIMPVVTVTAEVNGKTVKLKKNRDYIVFYDNNTDVGTATITVEGTGAYEGTLTKTFSITKGSLGSVTLAKKKMPYNGTAQEPAVTVKAGSVVLAVGRDYTVTYKNNTKAGTATVTVKGKGNFKGTLTKKFTITPVKILKVTLSKTTLDYTGKARKPIPTVTTKINGRLVTLKKNTDYTVKYENNVEPGTATVTVTGKGNYKGTIVKTFTITAP